MCIMLCDLLEKWKNSAKDNKKEHSKKAFFTVFFKNVRKGFIVMPKIKKL